MSDGSSVVACANSGAIMETVVLSAGIGGTEKSDLGMPASSGVNIHSGGITASGGMSAGNIISS